MEKTRKKYDINYYELNTNNNLRESAFMLFLQDAATVNAKLNGFGYDWVRENNCAWFLLKYRIELKKYPKNITHIEIETESRGLNRLFAFRDFIIYDENNEKIGKVASCWAIVDLETKSMVMPDSAKTKINVYEKRGDDLIFNKIRLPETFDYEKEMQVRFDDLDVNHHANNSNYISWALEALPYKFRKEHTVKNLDIQFKKDISLGEIFISKAVLDETTNRTIHLIQNKSTGDELVLFTIDWD